MSRFPAGRAPAGATVAVLAAVAALVVVPLLRLVQVAWSEGAGPLGGILRSPSFAAAVRNTVLLALAVSAAAVPLGIGLALVLRRPDLPGRAFWRVAVLLPVLVPDFVLGYSWTQAYGPAGFTDALLGWSWAAVPGPVQVWLVLAVNAVPIACLVVAAGLAARAEPDLERAARASGAGRATVLRTVTLPLLAPAAVAAAVLVFALTLGAFAVPQVIGTPSGFTTVTTRIYADLSLGADPSSFVEAVVLALLLVVLAAAFVGPADALLGARLRAARGAAPAGGASGAGPSTAGRWLAAGLAGYLLVTLVLPLVALVLAALTRAVGLPPTPAHWSLVHFRQVLTDRTVEALARSVVLAASAATILLVLGSAVVAVQWRGGRGLGTALTLTFVLPGSTLAVALLLAYGRWLGGSSVLILLAYLAKFWAFAQRPLSGAVDRLPPEEWQAGRVSGASAPTALRTVVLPPLTPALAAAWLLCFLTALHEVTMSSLLYGPGSETLAVVVLNSEELGQVGPTAALSVLLTVLVAVPALVLGPLVRRLRARPGGSPPAAVVEAAARAG